MMFSFFFKTPKSSQFMI